MKNKVALGLNTLVIKPNKKEFNNLSLLVLSIGIIVLILFILKLSLFCACLVNCDLPWNFEFFLSIVSISKGSSAAKTTPSISFSMEESFEGKFIILSFVFKSSYIYFAIFIIELLPSVFKFLQNELKLYKEDDM